MKTYEPDERGLVLACSQCGQRNRLPYERIGLAARCPQCRSSLPTPSEPIEIADEAAFHALTGRCALPVLVDFWAPWCGPCRMVAPELAKVAAEGAGQWLVAKVNTEELPRLAQAFRVSSIPLLAMFRQGREVARQPGAMPAAGIRQFIATAK